MRVLVAPNAFKGCLTASEAAEAMARGVLAADPSALVGLMPISDGGDGLIEALLAGCGGRKVFVGVRGPLGERRWAPFGLLPDRTAVVEMAQASGLALVPAEKRDVWSATSFGTGQLITKALDLGARRIWVGMGGSATNDGGIGMAQALGAVLLGADGRPVPFGARGLEALARIDLSRLDRRLRRAEVLAVSDVTNPLLGPKGSARVYGPQKGLKIADIPRLEAALRRCAGLIHRELGLDVARLPGAGAAGGLGAGLAAFLGARIVPGAPLVLKCIGADARIRSSDLVLTGEGRLDAQSLFGKAPVALAEAARRRGVPVIAACGSWDPSLARRLKARGILRVVALTERVTESRAMREAGKLLAAAISETLRSWTAAWS